METFLIVAVVLTIISNGIHFKCAECYDFEDYFIDEYGWINLTACVGVSVIMAGFIFWSWQIMLIILLVLVVVGVSVLLIFLKTLNKEDDKGKKSVLRSKSTYKCKNCGSNFIKEVVEDEYEETRRINYICEHCGISGSLKELRSEKGNKQNEEIEIDDFEEEYFDACLIMGFRPYNTHTQKQIDRKYDKLMDQIENGEISYEDDARDDEDILNEAYDFFNENKGEIEDYLSAEENIKERFDFYQSEEVSDE